MIAAILAKVWVYMAVAVVAMAGVWTIQTWRFTAKISKIEMLQAQADATAQMRARAVEQQRVIAITEVRDDADKKIKLANDDAAASDYAAGRLRVELEALRKRSAPSHSSTTNPSQTAGDPIGLLVDVLERMESTGRTISKFADQSHIAGLTCEQAYAVNENNK